MFVFWCLGPRPFGRRRAAFRMLITLCFFFSSFAAMCLRCLIGRLAGAVTSPFFFDRSETIFATFVIGRQCDINADWLTFGTTGAPSPSDRVQMLSQPRRMSTGTARSAHSVPEIATPVSQPGHWQPQPQHTYSHHVSSPHVDTPPAMGEVQAPQHESVRWSPHPGHPQQHHQVSMPVQDPSVHAVEQPNMSYPSPYVMESNTRSMSYPLENANMVTSQPMPMSGYGTPTSHPSPHASEYQRHMSVPMHHQAVQGQGPPQHQQHHTSAPYGSYPVGPQQGYPPQQVNHSGDMSMMHPQHGQTQMMSEQGQHIVYQPYQSNMKVEH
jgi:hypothetical protein